MTRECFKKEDPIISRVLLSDEDSSQIKGGFNFSVRKSFADKFDSIKWVFPDSEEEPTDLSIDHIFTESGNKTVKVVGITSGEVTIIPTTTIASSSSIIPIERTNPFKSSFVDEKVTIKIDDDTLFIDLADYHDEVEEDIRSIDGTDFTQYQLGLDDLETENFYIRFRIGFVTPAIPSELSGIGIDLYSYIVFSINRKSGSDDITVSATMTSQDGKEEFSTNVIVDVDKYTIDDLIAADMPQGLSIVPETKLIWIDKWQEFISLLVSPPIKPVDIHNYIAYPALVNNLIAKLVVYDAFMKAAQGAMVLMMQTASGSGPEYQSKFEQMSEDSGEGHGQEKSIETGPAKVEWYDVANSIDAFFKNGAGEDGTSVFDILRRQICALAARLKIKLWMCPKEPMPTIIPRMTHVAPSFIRRRAFFVNHSGNNHKHHK